MVKTKANEREFQGKVSVWISKAIEAGGLPFQNCTTDSSLYGLSTVRFPDVLITLDKECKIPFCGWELKQPTVNVRDKKLLKDALEKAQVIDAKYTVTWNMQTAVIWKVPPKTRQEIQEDDKVREYGPYPICTAESLRDPRGEEMLQEICSKLLFDLGRLYKEETINLPQADTTVFVDMIKNASEKLAAFLKTDIAKATSDRAFNKRL